MTHALDSIQRETVVWVWFFVLFSRIRGLIHGWRSQHFSRFVFRSENTHAGCEYVREHTTRRYLHQVVRFPPPHKMKTNLTQGSVTVEWACDKRERNHRGKEVQVCRKGTELFNLYAPRVRPILTPPPRGLEKTGSYRYPK